MLSSLEDMNYERAENLSHEGLEEKANRALDELLEADLAASEAEAKEAGARDAAREKLLGKLLVNAKDFLEHEDFETALEPYLLSAQSIFKNAGRKEDENEIRAMFAVAVLSVARGSEDEAVRSRADAIIKKLVGGTEQLKHILAEKVHPEIIDKAEI